MPAQRLRPGLISSAAFSPELDITSGTSAAKKKVIRMRVRVVRKSLFANSSSRLFKDDDTWFAIPSRVLNEISDHNARP